MHVFQLGTVAGSDTLDNPCLAGLVQAGWKQPGGSDALVGNGIQAMLPNQTYPYYMQWNVGIQHQFGSSSSVQVSHT